jgi:RNA-directed DNA polymerase
VKTKSIIHYPIEKSPFYKLSSSHKLAEYLEVDLPVLLAICKQADANYKQFDQEGRWIETPLRPLKALQAKVHKFLSRIAPPDFLFSGYKGRSAVTNAEHHKEAATLPMIKLDVRRFYPSCQGGKVYDFFKSHLLCSPHVAGMLTRLCTIGSTKNSAQRHLPTGGTTSAILAYLAYRDMFASISKFCEALGLKISVLADDITISGERAQEALAPVKEMLEAEGLHSNWKKQKIWPASHNFKLVTGCVVTPKGLRVPLKLKQNIGNLRAELKVAATGKRKAKLYQRWVGSLASAGQIESRFMAGAQKGMEEWKADSAAWQSHLAESKKRRPRRSPR